MRFRFKTNYWHFWWIAKPWQMLERNPAGLPLGGLEAHTQTSREDGARPLWSTPLSLGAFTTVSHSDPRLRFNRDPTNGNSFQKSVLCPNEESKLLWTHRSPSQTYIPELEGCQTCQVFLRWSPSEESRAVTDVWGISYFLKFPTDWGTLT